MDGKRLPEAFYARPALEVAPELVGKVLVRRLRDDLLTGIVVEVEAYMGSEDPASHAFRGETPRNRSMFGPPAHLYVYRSYGIHFCANVVTSPPGVATAVLLRALEPVSGIPVMSELRSTQDDRLLCRGPGRLCQALGITTEHDGLDLDGDEIFILDAGSQPAVVSTPRVGVNVAADHPWRFVSASSRYLSRPLPR